MELAIASASKTNDTITIKAAKSTIGNSLYTEGKAAFTKKAYADAAAKLNSALTFDYKNKECYYLLASTNNFIKKYDEAITAANLGLAMEDQAPDRQEDEIGKIGGVFISLQPFEQAKKC